MAFDFRSAVQKIGMAISRRVFTKRVLAHGIGKSAYLFLYTTFKKVFESKELARLRVYLPAGSTVLDIGANVGVTSIFFSQCVGPTGSVLAFEPDPIMGDVFLFHVKRAGMKNIRLFPVALGEQDGVECLFQNDSNRADNRMVFDPEMMSKGTYVSVNTRSITSMVVESPELFSQVRFVKIDVQGYETRVLAGMAGWLHGLERKPVIHLEFWPYGLQKAGSSAEKLLALCVQLGYTVDAEVVQRAQQLKGPNEYIDVTLIPKVS